MNSKELAKQVRIDELMMTNHSKESHIGAALSVTDIVCVLYNDILNISPKTIESNDRDRFILSKGHSCTALYSCLAELGFFDRDLLKTFCDNGSILSGHASYKVPGVEFSTGSLGHGCCVACGMAFSAKKYGDNYETYVVVGDGECNEGSLWEMVMFAAQHKLDNFTMVVDRNKMQALGFCSEIMDLQDLGQKFSNFGWDCYNVDGHDHVAMSTLFNKIRTEKNNKPKVVIANTIKGKGVSFMENQLKWHYKDPQEQDYENALIELKGEQ